MKPIAIFRHAPGEGAGYFASVLERRSVPSLVIAVDEGEPIPPDPARFAGLVFMGGPMSVNDELSWIARELELIRAAARRDVPVLGHCLGCQLLAKAFGGTVVPSPVKEIGWGEVRVSENDLAQGWLGELAAFESFHWHGETFSIPPGGTRVMENAHCANQAFALGKHFGMQCHVEMTRDMVRAWVRDGAAEMREAKASPGVQSAEEIERDLDARLQRLHEAAERIYERWLEGLSRGS